MSPVWQWATWRVCCLLLMEGPHSDGQSPRAAAGSVCYWSQLLGWWRWGSWSAECSAALSGVHRLSWPFCCRLFDEEDAEAIEEDLDALRNLFFADGEGLPNGEINSLCQPVQDLITVLQLQTAILIQNFKDVSTAWGCLNWLPALEICDRGV